MNADCGLNIHHIVFIAWQYNFIILVAGFAETIPGFSIHPMKTEQADSSRNLGIARHDTAAFAGCHIFIGMKTKDLGIAETAKTFTFISSTHGMRRVFEYA